MHALNRWGSIVRKLVALCIPQAQSLQAEYEQRYCAMMLTWQGDLESSLSLMGVLSHRVKTCSMAKSSVKVFNASNFALRIVASPACTMCTDCSGQLSWLNGHCSSC